MLSSQQELERFLDKSSALFTKAIRDIFRARYGRTVDENSPIKAMADLIGNTMKLADLNGRKRILMEADHVASKAKFAIEKTPLSPLPFVEAIEDLISREPRLAIGYQEVSRLYNTEHVFALAKSVNQNLTNRIQKAIGDSVERGEGLPEFDKLWREITPWSQAYGDVVYRTNASTAYTNGRFAQAEDEDVKEVIPAMVFYSMHLPDSRPNHAAADGLIAATDDPIWKTFKPPLGYNSYLPDNIIEGRVEAASKAPYSGPAVFIKTRKGSRLSVTINHPVLTAFGFVPAGRLKKGDNLVCHHPSVKAFISSSWNGSLPLIEKGRGTVDDKYSPSSIENIFNACWRQRARATIPERFTGTLPLDFHGDATFYKGDVHIVGADGLLPSDIREGFFEDIEKFSLMDYHGTPLLGSHGNSVLVRAKYVSFGAGSDLDIFRQEPIGQAGSRDPQLFGQLKERFSFDVFLDDIIDIEVHPYVGHVYDLQSPLGYIVANGVVSSNCACGTNFVSKYELERRGLISNGQVVRYLPPTFASAHPDEGFRPGGWEF